MPSDAKKKQAQKKKELAKARQTGKKVEKKPENGEEKEPSPQPNGGGPAEENGSVEISEEGK
jgi:ATP-binding cassette subfamily F protein 2